MSFLYVILDKVFILCYTLYSKNKGEHKKMKAAELVEITDNDKRFVYLVIIEMWKKFMPEKAYSKDDIQRLKEYKDNFYVLTQWLKNDVIYLISLTYSEREQQDALLEEVNSWIKEQMGRTNVYSKICMSEFSLEKIKQRLEVQSDWEKAIDDVEEYREEEYKGLYKVGYIASVMDFGLSEDNLSQLALIHKNAPKDSKRRTVIEQLLEDINYHTENSDFSSGNYERYIIEEDKGE